MRTGHHLDSHRQREPHRSAILARDWDLAIIDEAHHCRNRATQLWRRASELRKQFILLLTATPVQNDLEELFNLVTLRSRETPKRRRPASPQRTWRSNARNACALPS